MAKELSVFIDESGDFGNYDPKCPYYIIGAVFHNQVDDLAELFRAFDYALSMTALKDDGVHIGPLIRREDSYINLTTDERLQIYRRTKYYDNGQRGVAKIIRIIFKEMFNNSEIKVVRQQDYKLLQAADFVCTATLTKLKMKHKTLSRSERRLLGDNKMIEKMMFKPLRNKQFKNP